MTKPKKGFLDGYKTYDTSQGYGDPKQWRQAFHQRMNKDDAEEILKGQTETPYSILGVPTTATDQDIKRAFRYLIMKWHPDKNPNNTAQAEEMSKKIIAAYTILTEI